MHVVNTDTLSHRKNSPEKCLMMVEKEKNRNYQEACFRKHVVSVDGLIGVEAEAILKCIATRLSKIGNRTTQGCAAM